jgi:hypothetical protein
LCEGYAEDKLVGPADGTVDEGALEAGFAATGGETSPLAGTEGGVVVNLGTTLMGTLTACDLLRAGISVVFVLVRLDVSSAKVVIS